MDETRLGVSWQLTVGFSVQVDGILTPDRETLVCLSRPLASPRHYLLLPDFR